MTDLAAIIQHLKGLADPNKVKGIARFGIPIDDALGVSMPQLRKLARTVGKDQALADALWRTSIHEAKLLATLVAEPASFTIQKADLWLKDLYSWDICDQWCLNLLIKTPDVLQLPERWAGEAGEFQKRASLAIIAVIAVHKKTLDDQALLEYKPLLHRAASDPRNFVKKAVNWAIRQIGKRNENLRLAMLAFCEELLLMNHKSAHWIARDALRELKTKS